MTNPIKLDLTADHVYEHIDTLGGCHHNNPEPVYVDPVQKTKEIVSKLQERGPISHEQRVFPQNFPQPFLQRLQKKNLTFIKSVTCPVIPAMARGMGSKVDTPCGTPLGGVTIRTRNPFALNP